MGSLTLPRSHGDGRKHATKALARAVGQAEVSKAEGSLQKGPTYYSTPATWKPCAKQKSVHMAYVMEGSAFEGPMRSRPLTLSRTQAPSVDQLFGWIVCAERTGPLGCTGVVDAKGASVVKMVRAWSYSGSSAGGKIVRRRRGATI